MTITDHETATRGEETPIMEQTAREHAARFQERMQERTQEIGELTGQGVESMAAWLDANQRLWRDVMQLSIATARDGVRFFWECQSRAMELLTAPAAGLVQMQKETAGWYEKTMREGVETMQRALGAIVATGEQGDGPATQARRIGRRFESLRSQWSQLRGRVRQQWDRLTDEELEQVQGSPERLAGALQERYGWSREQAEQELERWLDRQRLARAS